jgi:hypothetical protein
VSSGADWGGCNSEATRLFLGGAVVVVLFVCRSPHLHRARSCFSSSSFAVIYSSGWKCLIKNVTLSMPMSACGRVCVCVCVCVRVYLSVSVSPVVQPEEFGYCIILGIICGIIGGLFNNMVGLLIKCLRQMGGSSIVVLSLAPALGLSGSRVTSTPLVATAAAAAGSSSRQQAAGSLSTRSEGPTIWRFYRVRAHEPPPTLCCFARTPNVLHDGSAPNQQALQSGTHSHLAWCRCASSTSCVRHHIILSPVVVVCFLRLSHRCGRTERWSTL